MTRTVTATRRTISATRPVTALAWSAGDTAWAIAWFAIGIAARAPLVSRIEGALDHDQSVVGLMALDIAAGRRWPIFFDGQRYMGAVEAYTAAAFVAVFGHSPVVVALAPLLYFGLFVAGQYLVWRGWSDRATGHLAALLTVVASPMLTLWSIVPRGGYIEVLAWALPVLGVYRRMIRPGGAARSRRGQAGWGFLLAVGYFLNPLSLIVYLTLALDWTLGRHGADLRKARGLDGGWVDSRWCPVVWVTLGAVAVVALAVCCHVDFANGQRVTPFVFVMDWMPRVFAAPLGILGLLTILGAAAWWSGAAARGSRLVAGHPWFTLGVIAALVPFLLNNVMVCWGWLPWNRSLPIWIRAPWNAGVNIRSGTRALGPLVGSSPEAVATLLIGQGVELPRHVWPALSAGLAWFSPLVVATATALIASLAWRDRHAWRRFWSLQGDEPTPPTLLVLLGLLVTTSLYLLQATSLNVSSIRYLVPVWIMLPGILASALRRLPAGRRSLAGALLLLPWGTAQVNLWADLDRPSPLRAVTQALARRGVKGIVAQTPVALIVANLSHGQVGSLEYRPSWPRLGDRYASRIRPEGPVICVVDLNYPWASGGDFTWPPGEDLGRDLRELTLRHPRQVRLTERVGGHYEVWDVALPRSEVLANDTDPLHAGTSSEKLSPVSPQRP